MQIEWQASPFVPGVRSSPVGASHSEMKQIARPELASDWVLH